MSYLDEDERNEWAFAALKNIHKSAAGKSLIHAEKVLINKEGYDFPCPICGATVDYSGGVHLLDTRAKASCAACLKQVKRELLKEKLLASVIRDKFFAAVLCPECFNSDKMLQIRGSKRELKAFCGTCDECNGIFEADTLEEIKRLMQEHPEHGTFKIYQEEPIKA